MTDPDGAHSPGPYVLGHTDRELERLSKQARLIDPITRRFFRGAGIAPGMRVLDVGSGAGDVAFLAAELVGPGGEVVGSDRSAAALEKARARAAERSLSNVVFREGDAADMEFDGPFDAVVGRYVLMFQRDPTAMVRKLATRLGPGGVVVFHEPDWDGVRSVPPAPTYDRASGWIVETLVRSGHAIRMGKGLYPTFVAAGLPPPTMRLDALFAGGENNAEPLELLADIVVTLLPEMERLGVVTAVEARVETLFDRMFEEARSNDCVLVGRYEIGAWSRVSRKP